MSQHEFTFTPIDPHIADVLRAAGGPTYVADSNPGYPCRQCLQDAKVGEILVLVSHDPFEHDSPYRSGGPIFLHRDGCAPYAGGTRVPDQLTIRQLSVRAFDDAAMMIDAAVVDGNELAQTINRFFADQHAHHVHVHNATRGCWAVRVDRRVVATTV
jgi:Protein of unknown function (DUF1203)